MAKGLIRATAEDMARNRGRVLSLYRQMLRSLSSPDLPLNLAARLAKKAEVRAIFMLGSEERSFHNIEDLVESAECALSHLRKALTGSLDYSPNQSSMDMDWVGQLTGRLRSPALTWRTTIRQRWTLVHTRKNWDIAQLLLDLIQITGPINGPY